VKQLCLGNRWEGAYVYKQFSFGMISPMSSQNAALCAVAQLIYRLATGRTTESRSSSPEGSRILISPYRSDRLWGPSRGVTGALFPGVKRQGREADHLPPGSAQVEKTWTYVSNPPYASKA
jgi:hypothetical protein